MKQKRGMPNSTLSSNHSRYLLAAAEIKRAYLSATTERWAKQYKQNTDTFKRLVKAQARLAISLRKAFKAFAPQASQLVDWNDYQNQKNKLSAAFNFGADAQWQAQQQRLYQLFTAAFLDSYGIGADAAEAITGIGISKDTLDSAITKRALDHAGELAKNITDTTRQGIANSIDKSLAMGETTDEAAARIEDYVDNPDRAELIARTESVAAYQGGMAEFASSTGATTKEWQTSDDPCPICEDNESDGAVGIDESFSSGDDEPPAHPNCLLAGQEVEAFGVSAKMVAPYDGPAVELTTASGIRLSVTPNHLVATRLGWKPAAMLNESDNLVRTPYGIEQMAATVSPDRQTVKAMIEDVAIPNQMRLRRMPATAIDFHGDGAACQYIDVVLADGALRDERHVTASQLLANQKLRLGDVGRKLLTRLCPQHQLGFAGLAASSGDVGLARHDFAQMRLGGVHHSSGLGVAAKRDASLLKALGQSSSGDVDLWRQLLDRFAGTVALDQVVKVRDYHFVGHVYDLTSKFHVYTANSILTHNCECDLVYNYDDSSGDNQDVTDTSE